MTDIESQYIWVVDENGFGGEVLLDDYLNYLKDGSPQPTGIEEESK